MSQEASGIPSLELLSIGKDIFTLKAVDCFDLRSAFAPVLNVSGMPEGDDEEEEDDETDKGGTGDGGDDGEGDGSGGDDADKDVKDPDKKRLSDEAAKHRNNAKAEKKRADELAAKLQAIEDKDKPEIERLTKENKDLASKVSDLESRNQQLAIENEFVLKHANRFDDPDVARLVLEKKYGKEDGINVDEDGEVTGMKEAVEALLKEKPKWAKGSGDDGGSGSGNDQPSGRQTNGKAKKDGLNTEALAKKFPALRGRG